MVAFVEGIIGKPPAELFTEKNLFAVKAMYRYLILTAAVYLYQQQQLVSCKHLLESNSKDTSVEVSLLIVCDHQGMKHRAWTSHLSHGCLKSFCGKYSTAAVVSRCLPIDFQNEMHLTSSNCWSPLMRVVLYNWILKFDFKLKMCQVLFV